MTKITYEDFKRTNNMLKTNFHNSGLHNRVLTITGINFKQDIVKVKAIDDEHEWQESWKNFLVAILNGFVCISNPSIVQKWNGFLDETKVANYDKKQKMQSILLRTVAEDLSDSIQTFEAICVLRFGLNKEDIQKMRQGIMPKYNDGLYRNVMKYILSCNSESVNSKLIRQGIVLSNC
ncbi:MAG: hypothetical protein IJZ36_03975 [Bacilli bacterium]|nr:hypothetical protein [Bacilli bacterium]